MSGNLNAWPPRITETAARMWSSPQSIHFLTEQTWERVRGAVEGAAERVAVFKGPLLAYTVYDRPLDRTWCDLDLLTTPEAFLRVFEALRAAGFAPVPPDRRRRWSHHRYYQWALVSPLGVTVELHRDLIAFAPFKLDVPSLLERAVPFRLGTTPALGLALEDHLHVLCRHIAKEYFKVESKHFNDLERLCGKGGLDWKVFTARVRAAGAPAGVHYALGIARVRFGARVPAEVLEALAPCGIRRRWLDRWLAPDRFSPERFTRLPISRLRPTLLLPCCGLYPRGLRLMIKYGWARMQDLRLAFCAPTV